MQCDQAKNDLSAYYDDELPSGRKLAVQNHVQECESCRHDLQVIQRLSQAAQALTTPPPSKRAWQRLELQLESARHTSTPGRPVSRRRLFAAAALLLVTASAGIGWLRNRHDDNAHLAMNFDRYLTLFPEDPDAAQQILLTNYEHQEVDLQQAEELLEYRPTVAQRMPDSYSLHKVYVFDMPCCRCVQTVFAKEGEPPVCVFEHDADQPMWFGDRPSIHVQCSGKSTSLIPFDRYLAASWPQGKRHVTVIGVRDVSDVVELVRQWDQQPDAA